ncbi:unnamed protein product [Notodromas monacha]|uniref:Farnesyl pyrophosphate synthase n=1 Tax=Notodromas monacha TaxID=399045 RepID=A0A7R9BND1_9CRUS|nr:unnamed protein product [Notodromas monacha]CAG0917834.1 unnamed protein product [Notodromas monacha]
MASRSVLMLMGKSRLLNARVVSDNARLLSTASPGLTSAPTFPKRHGQTATKDERREFMGMFPDIVRDLTGDPEKRNQDVERWFHKVLQFNVPSGRKSRGLAAVASFRTLVPPEERSEERMRNALIVGWCVELIHNVFVIQDDIAKGRQVRRGRSSWHNMDHVGVKAINDALMLENSMYFLLWKYLRNEPYYIKLVELFHQVALKTSAGRTLDALTNKKDGTPNFEKFTMDRYMRLIRNKNAYYTFLLPMAAGMYAAGVQAPELHRQAKTVQLDIGEFYQIQDDFLDCFGEGVDIVKIGSDIEEGRISWLAVVFLQRAPPALKEEFMKNYGKKEAESVAKVKGLYEELKLHQLFDAYEEQNYRRLYDEIQQCSLGVPKGLMMTFLEKLFRG